jgi:replicative DNA helicase
VKHKDLREYKGDDRIVPAMELAAKFAKEPPFRINVQCGIKGIDEATEGFRDGELITISGRTKQGKTLLAQTFTNNFIKQGAFPLWFSFEVPARQFLKQFPDFLPTPHIFMPMELKPHAMDWIEDRILESLQKFNSRIVFIDHLHFLFDIGRTKNASLEIGQVIRRLKLFAINYEIIIFLLCHMTKVKDENDALNYEMIRDSSLIAQESDSVIMVSRTLGDEGRNAICQVCFHRHTGILNQRVGLKKDGWWLTERTLSFEERGE